MGGFRSGVTWNVLCAAVIWATVGTSVAAAICFFVILIHPLFVFMDAGPAAALLGAIEGLWLYMERSKTANARDFIRFGCISGAGFGLLALPPALAQMDAYFVDWFVPPVLVVAALVGGGSGACSVPTPFESARAYVSLRTLYSVS